MKVYLETYGCTANKADESLIKGILLDNNYQIEDKIDNSDLIIILTCTVINTTEQRMLSRLKILKKTGKKIIVAGCMASVQQELIRSILPDAKLLKPQEKEKIIYLIKDQTKEYEKTILPKNFEGVFAPISISEGCLFSCSYCITSIARGKLKSFKIQQIKNDVKSALNQGCKEVQLTAQDTASYGLDANQNLGKLIEEICKIDGEYRIRVGMMNPHTALKNFDDICNSYNCPKIYKFLHLPVQSGDNFILEKMNRKYRVDDFLKVVEKFREKYPDLTLSTDIIVGFPTETDKQFEKSIELLKSVKPDITNITRYSARPFTKAKTMKGRVKTEIVKERSRILSDLCSKISEGKNKEKVGKRYNCLITEKGKNNTFVGRSENYKPVVIDKKLKIGKFCSVEIVDFAPTYLIGRLI